MAEYITQSEVEAYTGLTVESTETTFVATLIIAARKYIETYTNRIFNDADTDQTLYYDGNGTHKLPIHDLRDITSLTVDSVALTENTDYYLYPLNTTFDGKVYEWVELIQPETKMTGGFNSRMSATSRYVFREAQRNITIVGKFGFSTTPPADVKIAALKIVGGIIKENIGDTDVKELTAESLGEYSVSYAKIADVAHALGIDTILDQYKRDLPYEIKNPKTGIVRIS